MRIEGRVERRQGVVENELRRLLHRPGLVRLHHLQEALVVHAAHGGALLSPSEEGLPVGALYNSFKKTRTDFVQRPAEWALFINLQDTY